MRSNHASAFGRKLSAQDSPVRKTPPPKPLQPGRSIVEPVVIEMEPLADAEPWRVIGEMPRRPFRRAVLAQQPHVEMPVIRRTFRLLVAGRRRPGLRQIIQAVPVDARGAA